MFLSTNGGTTWTPYNNLLGGPTVARPWSCVALSGDGNFATAGATTPSSSLYVFNTGSAWYRFANTSAQLKKTMGWVAYVDGAARSLPGAKAFRIVYELEGHRLHSTKVHSMLFANCGALPAGIELIPGASLTDGMLDVAVIQPTGWFGWLGVWRKVWWDNSVLRRTRAGRRIVERRRESSVRYLRGPSIEAGVEEPQPVELDGDEFGEASRIRCRVLPGALLIAAPRGHRF